jgi:hypothetical protein
MSSAVHSQTLEKRFMLKRVMARSTSSSRHIELAQANCPCQPGIQIDGASTLTLLACPA